MTYDLAFHHHDRVLVTDGGGNILCRGTIRGRHQTRTGPHYDVQPWGEPSLSERLVGVPEARILRLGKPYLAYEGTPACEPRRVRDEA